MVNPILKLAAFVARLLPAPFRQGLYRARPLAGWLRRMLNRAAPSGFTPVTVAAGGLTGARLMLDLQIEKDYWLGTYEPELQMAIHDLVEPGMVAYDVGANIGYISLLLARAVGGNGRVYAFEALPANVERLRAHVKMNTLDDTVTIVAGAVAHRSGPIRFWVGPSNGMGKAEGSAGRQAVAYGEVINVRGIALDDFIYMDGNPPPAVVKMDIEGGEMLALPAMQRLLSEARPLILLELHGPESARVAWETLTTLGYKFFRMQSGYPEIYSVDELSWKAYTVARYAAENRG